MSAPLSASRMRREYSASWCDTSRMVGVRFHGWPTPLPVERRTADAWRAFSAVMEQHDYRFRESAGGTYNCRPIAGTNDWSLHAYGLAIDLNPSDNPHGTDTTDQPAGFRRDVKKIRTNSGRRVFAWGGDWDQPDTMHWQIGATPAELETGIKDDNMPLSNEDIAKVARATVELLLAHPLSNYDPMKGRPSQPASVHDALHRIHVRALKTAEEHEQILASGGE